MPDYEIYALKYAGPFVRTGAHLMWYQDWDRIENVRETACKGIFS